MQIQHWWSHLHTLQCSASTLHGILRAPHGDGKEAILLATPVSGVYASILGKLLDAFAAIKHITAAVCVMKQNVQSACKQNSI